MKHVVNAIRRPTLAQPNRWEVYCSCGWTAEADGQYGDAVQTGGGHIKTVEDAR